MRVNAGEDGMSLYYSDGKQKIGPISKAELQNLIKAKKVNARTLIWQPGMDGWQELRRFARPKSQAAPVAAVPARTSQPQQTCVECGRPFAVTDMIPFRDSWVCAGCKPAFVQKMKEGVSVGGQMLYAGFWIRFAALLIDGLILGAINLMLHIPLALIAPTAESDSTAFLVYMPLTMLLQLAIPAAFDVFFVGKYGATPGKMACRLKIVESEGGKVTYARAIGRHFAKYISMITLYIGFLMAAFDAQKRSLHDRICDTRVIRRK
jgi:uncharacterized RDD family membrane protein YckC